MLKRGFVAGCRHVVDFLSIIIILSHRDLIQPKCVIKIREKNITKTYNISCSVRAFVSLLYNTQIYVCMYYVPIYIYNILYSAWRKRAHLVSHAFPLATRVVYSGYTENTKKILQGTRRIYRTVHIFFPVSSTAIVNISSLWLKTYINNCYCNSYIYYMPTVNWTLVYYNVKEKLTL